MSTHNRAARWAQALDALAENGINLVAILECATLPPAVTAPLAQAGVDVAAYARLVLLGNGGRAFWDALPADGLAGPDPIDRRSAALAADLARDGLDDREWRLLYPGSVPIPLQQLGELAGWCRPSPLGLGIHAGYGLWFAYRAAFLTRVDAPLTSQGDWESPCLTCGDKPCIAACPAGALDAQHGMDIAACSRHRMTSDSSCAARCLARLACPVAPEHRYGDAQLAYHYGHSLATIRRYWAAHV